MLLEYKVYEQYGGTVEEGETYDRLEYRARAVVVHATFGRVLHMSETPECVQRLMFELIELYNAQSSIAGSMVGVTSASNDGVSVSYGTDLTNNAIQAQTYALIKDYLHGQVDDNGVPLLYKGVYYCDSVWK